MMPKVESVDDVALAEKALDAAAPQGLPLHVLIESPAAVHRAFDIAAHPRVQSLSFGLMDFVSAHGGAIPVDGMSSPGSSPTRWWCAPSSRLPRPAMPLARCRRTAW
jgi:citrate lyase subunit beta/citryl-CoA lyase